MAIQYYKGIKIELIKRNYQGYNAKRYTLNGTNQNVWIPNKHLMPDGALAPQIDIDYVFLKSWKQCCIAGICTDLGDLRRKLKGEIK